MFAWFEKCRKRVISRSALLANCIFSKTRVTSFIATVSPDISSAAELTYNQIVTQRVSNKELTSQRHTLLNPTPVPISSAFPDEILSEMTKQWNDNLCYG